MPNLKNFFGTKFHINLKFEIKFLRITIVFIHIQTDYNGFFYTTIKFDFHRIALHDF